MYINGKDVWFYEELNLGEKIDRDIVICDYYYIFNFSFVILVFCNIGTDS